MEWRLRKVQKRCSGSGLFRTGLDGTKRSRTYKWSPSDWLNTGAWGVVEDGRGREGLTRGSVCEEWGIFFSVGSWGGASGRWPWFSPSNTQSWGHTWEGSWETQDLIVGARVREWESRSGHLFKIRVWVWQNIHFKSKKVLWNFLVMGCFYKVLIDYKVRSFSGHLWDFFFVLNYPKRFTFFFSSYCKLSCLMFFPLQWKHNGNTNSSSEWYSQMEEKVLKIWTIVKK